MMKTKIIFLFIAFLLCSCVAKNHPVIKDMILENNNNFVLYVSNQSFDIKKTDIRVFIDGKQILYKDFSVKNQHYWECYSFNLTSGKHYFLAESLKGGIKIEKEFEIDSKKWALLNFCTIREGKKEPPYFYFEIFNEPISFL